MIDVVVAMTKYGVLLFWSVFAFSFTGILPPPYPLVIAWAAAFVVLMHLVEFLLIRFGVIKLVDSEASLLRTLIFGLSYWVPLLARRIPSSDVMQRQRIGNNVHDVIDNDH